MKLSFYDDRTPPWPCPRCEGAIRLVKEKLIVYQSNDLPKAIRYIKKEETDNLGYIQYRFSGMFVCDGCHLKIMSLGYTHAFENRRLAVGASYLRKEGNVLFPIFFDPPLQLFSVGESCPQEIKSQLENSFSLYWNDKASCANKVRTVIELLLDHQNVPKPNGSTLHSRIQVFKNQHQVFGSFLESAKWIGNTGSHGMGELSKIDLLDGFEFLHHVINRLYVDQDKTFERLLESSKAINQNKGPKSK